MASDKKRLFVELAKPDENGFSRWVGIEEFVGKYRSLFHDNGGTWERQRDPFVVDGTRYRLEVQKEGHRIVKWRLAGYSQKSNFNNSIRQDIKDAISKRKCVMLGVCGVSENTRIEVDHKDGRKDDWRVSNPETQRLDDFQPLCKAANDVKRQICKECRRTDKRWDAKNIDGNPYSFYKGDEHFTEELGCVGCYQYDPVEYRICSTCRISQETLEGILSRIYPDMDINEIKKRLK